jgi:hypothetical protein
MGKSRGKPCFRARLAICLCGVLLAPAAASATEEPDQPQAATAVDLNDGATPTEGNGHSRSFSDKLMDRVMNSRLHGFVSQGFLLSSGNNYLAMSKSGSFEFSEVGLNVTVPLSDRLRLGMQLFSQDLGPLGNYSAKFDWYYLDYKWKDWFGIRVGRIKVPLGLYNDTQDVDAARNAALLPQSVYPAQNRDYLLAQTGAELYGFIDLKQGGALDYRAYAGTIFLDLTNVPGNALLIRNLVVPYVLGGRLMWETPLTGLRVGVSAEALELDAVVLSRTSTQTAGSTDTVLHDSKPATVAVDALLTVGSLEYIYGDFNFAAEYSRWFIDERTSDQHVVPIPAALAHSVSERAYVMSSYRVTPWFQPGAYYSMLYNNVEHREGRENQQHDYAATLRFDLTDWWLLKLEGHYIYGTGALNSAMNYDQKLSTLTPNWGLLVLKTTGYF